jgi:hypothetical protein
MLSPQQFVDCTGHDQGCQTGGDLETPVRDLAMRKGLCTLSSYPYVAKDSTCKESACDVAVPVGAVRGYARVRSYSEFDLMEAVFANGPVAVGIHGAGGALTFYRNGILSGECSQDIDHAVAVVGFGVEEGHHDSGVLQKYWRLQNSWGPAWGEHGYFRLLRGVPGAGQCGLKKIPTYVRLASKDSLIAMMNHNISYNPPKETVVLQLSDRLRMACLSLPREITGTCSSEELTKAVLVWSLFMIICCLCCWCCPSCQRRKRGRGMTSDPDASDQEDDEEDEEDSEEEGDDDE